MKRIAYTFFAFVMIIAIAGTATAQQAAVDEASTAMRRFVQGRVNADPAGLARLMSFENNHGSFFRNHGLMAQLAPGTSLQSWTEVLEGNYSNGNRENLRIDHLKTSVFGDIAITTGYWTGNQVNSGGEVLVQGPWRFTFIWHKEGNDWLEVHRHISKMTNQP